MPGGIRMKAHQVGCGEAYRVGTKRLARRGTYEGVPDREWKGARWGEAY